MGEQRHRAVRARSRARWGLVLVLVALAAACGTSSDDAGGGATTASTVTTTTTTSAAEAAHVDHDTTVPDSSLSPCPDEAIADPHATAHEGDDAHTGGPPRDCRLPAAVQSELDAELDVTRAILERYPDPAAAQEGGYQLTEGNSHLVSWDHMDDRFDVEHPEMLLLDEANSTEVVAAVYYVVGDDTAPPEGFVGTRDMWHHHPRVCGVPGGGEDGTQLRCDEDDAPTDCEVSLVKPDLGASCGPPMPLDRVDGWMLHVWVAPGHPHGLGLFSAD